MSSLKTSLLLLSLLFAAAATLPAQGARFLIPERIERQTEADDEGLQQWAKWPALKCPSCKGAGKATCQTCARFGPDAKSCPECKRVKGLKAPCRVCAGEGKILDPLEVAPCPPWTRRAAPAAVPRPVASSLHRSAPPPLRNYPAAAAWENNYGQLLIQRHLHLFV